jgi:hypothetical protein
MKPVAFADIDELRRAHDALLAALDAERARVGASAGDRAALLGVAVAAQAFVARAVTSGTVLDELEDRTAAQVLIDYWCTLLARVGETCAAEHLAPFDASQLPELPEGDMPFRGLEAFDNEARFFGREVETGKLLALVQTTPLVLVSGPAGCGKSSLVMAGLLPALRAAVGADGRPAWRVAGAVRAGPSLQADLLRALRAAVQGDAGSAPGSSSTGDSLPWPQSVTGLALGGGAPLVVTIDQAEVLFTEGDEPMRDAVAAALGALLNARHGHRAVLILREEFEDRVLEHPLLARRGDGVGEGEKLAAGGQVGRFVVGPLGPEGLRAAIVGPAQRVGLHVQAEVVDDLVNLVAGQRSGLKLLQHALVQLWAARRRNRVTWEDYEPLRKKLEIDKWRFEAEHQASAAAREHATAERERQASAQERVLARHERRLRRAVSVAVAVLAVVIATLGWYSMRLREGNARLERGNAELQARTAALDVEIAQLGRQTENMAREIHERLEQEGALRAYVEQRERQALAAAAAAAPASAATESGSGAAPAASAPSPRARAAGASAAAAVAAPAAGAMVGPQRPAASASTAAPPTAERAIAATAAAAASSPAAAAVKVPATEEPSPDEKRWRARRFVHWIDTGRAGASAAELRREHPLSWAWAELRFEQLKLRTPLALAVLFDTAVAHGPLQAATMRARADPIDGSPESERRLIESFLARREALAATALAPQDEPRRIGLLRRRMAQEWQLDAFATAVP